MKQSELSHFFTMENTGITAQGHLRLLNAGLKLFNEKGVDAASVRELARRSNLSNPALYSHYDSKEALAKDIFSQILAIFREDANRLLNPNQALKDTLRRMRAHLAENFEFHPESNEAFQYIHQVGYRFFPSIQDARQTPMHAWVEYIRARQQAGDIREGNPRILACMLIGMRIKLIQFQKFSPETISPEELGEEFERSALLMLSKGLQS